MMRPVASRQRNEPVTAPQPTAVVAKLQCAPGVQLTVGATRCPKEAAVTEPAARRGRRPGLPR